MTPNANLLVACQDIMSHVHDTSKSLPFNSKRNNLVIKSALDTVEGITIPCVLLRNLRDAMETDK